MIIDIGMWEVLGHWGGMQEMVDEGLYSSAVEVYAHLQRAWEQGLQEHVPPSSLRFNIAAELEKLQASHFSRFVTSSEVVTYVPCRTLSMTRTAPA
jgi:hypothetical protein